MAAGLILAALLAIIVIRRRKADDITMCKGNRCPLKERCYRYLVESDGEWQSFFVDVPYRDRTCRCFWETRSASHE